VRTKLCGFTDQKTIDLAIASGAEFIGFVFYPQSSRNISPYKAGEISKNIPAHIKKVAVIVDAEDALIAQIFQHLKPDFLQIHSDHQSRILEIKKHFQIPIIKAFSISKIKDLEVIHDYLQIADYFLFDAKSIGIGGGGKPFDWKIMNNLKIDKGWFLSGGLNIENIEQAIKISGAQMIDLSSGIEEKKGIKSPKLITEFMSKINLINLKKNYE